LSKSGYKVKLVDYIAVPLFDIVGFYPANTKDGQYITALKGSKIFTRDEALARFDISKTKSNKSDDIIY
jgi:hypothetical protein